MSATDPLTLVAHSVDQLRADLNARLDRQDLATDRIEQSLNSKATGDDIDRISAELEQHEQEANRQLHEHSERISAVELAQRDETVSRKAADVARSWWRSKTARFGGFIVGALTAVWAIASTLQLFHVI